MGERNRTSRNVHHHSETSLDNYNFDHVIDNNSSIENLNEKVLTWINNVIHKI